MAQDDSSLCDWTTFFVGRCQLLGLTESMLAQRLNVEENVVGQWRAGEIPVPIHQAERLARELRVSGDVLTIRMLEHDMPDVWKVFYERIAAKLLIPPRDRAPRSAARRIVRYDRNGNEQSVE